MQSSAAFMALHGGNGPSPPPTASPQQQRQANLGMENRPLPHFWSAISDGSHGNRAASTALSGGSGSVSPPQLLGQKVRKQPHPHHHDPHHRCRQRVPLLAPFLGAPCVHYFLRVYKN